MCVAFLFATLPFTVIGFFIVPIAILFRKPDVSLEGKLIVNAPRWLWLWGNDEDGYEPAYYVAMTPEWNRYVRMWVWAAWRNSFNNIRFIRWLSPPPVVDEIKFWQSGRLYIIWQGLYTRFVYITSMGHWLTLGWKYWIDDSVNPCRDIRRFGVGFGCNYK